MLPLLFALSSLAAEVPASADAFAPSAYACGVLAPVQRVAPDADPLAVAFEDKRLRQARDMRTAGVVLTIGGPVLSGVGLVVVLVGALSQDQGTTLAGAVLGGVGVLGSASGPPLLIGGGGTAVGVARRVHLVRVRTELGWVSGLLFGASVATLWTVFATDSPAGWLAVPVALWGGGVVTGHLYAHRAIRAAEGSGLSAGIRWSPARAGDPGDRRVGTLGIVVGGTF